MQADAMLVIDWRRRIRCATTKKSARAQGRRGEALGRERPICAIASRAVWAELRIGRSKLRRREWNFSAAFAFHTVRPKEICELRG